MELALADAPHFWATDFEQDLAGDVSGVVVDQIEDDLGYEFGNSGTLQTN